MVIPVSFTQGLTVPHLYPGLDRNATSQERMQQTALDLQAVCEGGQGCEMKETRFILAMVSATTKRSFGSFGKVEVRDLSPPPLGN